MAKALRPGYDEQTLLLGLVSKPRLTLLELLKLCLLMDRNAHKEEFSYAYIHAVAAAAGYSCSVSPRLLDMEGIDMTITALGIQGTRRCPRIDLQVKCTSRTDIVGKDIIRYPLEIEGYNKLIYDDPTIPYYLVVVLVPDNPDEWLVHSKSEISLRYCGYWASLAGQPATQNLKSITVHVPRTNLFNPETLKSFMKDLNKRGT